MLWRRDVAGRRAEYFLLLSLLAIFIWKGLVPGWRSLNSDFPNYYLVAQLYRKGYPLSRVYDYLWLQRQKDHASLETPLVAYAPQTVFSSLPLAPFSSQPPLEAKRAWLFINLVLLGLTGYLLNSMTKLGVRRVAVLTFLCMDPLRMNFLYGQQHILVLFLLTLAAWLWLGNWPASSGATLAVAAALKIYPILFLLYFLRKKAWRAVTGLVVTSLGLLALSVRLFGYEVHRIYFMEVLPRAMRGENIDPYSNGWNSATALLHKLFITEPELNPHPLVHFPAAYAFLQPLVQALFFIPVMWLIGSSRHEGSKEKLDWGSYVVLLLILSTNPASYHHAVLILAAALVLDHLLAAGPWRHAGLFVVAYAFACLPLFRYVARFSSGWQTFLSFPRLYGLVALFVLLLWALADGGSRLLVSRLRSREAAAFGLSFAILVVAGTALNFRHLEGQFSNYDSRVIVKEASLMESEPSVAGHEILFTVLTPPVYSIEKLDVGSQRPDVKLTSFRFDRDAFHAVFAPDLSQAWVEQASATSRLVRFPLAGSKGEGRVVAVEDAERPAVSPTGNWLAFIREKQGRGGLWVRHLRPERSDVEFLTADQQLVSADLDVLDVTFASEQAIIFSADSKHGPELFMVDPAYPNRVSRQAFGPMTRYPAVSPDGRWIAFSHEEKGAWHLWVASMRANEKRRLTAGDCNSIEPAWFADSRTLVYATDCGRGLGLTALARVQAVP